MKNKTLKIALIILLLAIVTMSIISGTLSKYVETVSGTDSARVAKFDYTAKVGETEFTTTAASINLFNTVNDTEVYGTSANINTQKLVAPGTVGHFNIDVSNSSEVKVKVTYTISETNAGNIPIVYFLKQGDTIKYYSAKVSESTTVTVGADVQAVTGATAATINGTLSDMADVLYTELAASDGLTAVTPATTTTIGWFWAFGDGTTSVDNADTSLGTAETLATVTTNVNVTFTQMD